MSDMPAFDLALPKRNELTDPFDGRIYLSLQFIRRQPIEPVQIQINPVSQLIYEHPLLLHHLTRWEGAFAGLNKILILI